jgi:hypothetical protein
VGRYDDARQLIEGTAGPIAIMNCVYRQGKELTGEPCRQTDARRVCMTFRGAARWLVGEGTARAITRDEGRRGWDGPSAREHPGPALHLLLLRVLLRGADDGEAAPLPRRVPAVELLGPRRSRPVCGVRNLPLTLPDGRPRLGGRRDAGRPGALHRLRAVCLDVPVRGYLEVGPNGSYGGYVDLDDVKLEWIARFTYYEPRLSIESLPTIEAARADSFWGQMSSALGGMSILNGGGFFEALLAAYDWLGAQCIVRVGGRYQLGGNEILLDDCAAIAIGKLGPPTVSDSRVVFDLEDDRSILLRTLPRRTYSNNGRDAYTEPDRGRARPLLWGFKKGIRPVQYDIAYYGGGPVPLGVYEIFDTTGWAPGMYLNNGYWNLYFYENEETARARVAPRRTTMSTDSLSITINQTSGQYTGCFTVNRDLRPILITQENNKLLFDVGGSFLLATVPIVSDYAYKLHDELVGSVTEGLLKDLQSAMRDAASVGDIYCTFVSSTQRSGSTRAAAR